jgi:hypothetical protein
MAEEDKSSVGNEATAKHIATFRKTIIPKLAELGVSKLTINYSGSGDEGAVDGVDAEPEGYVIPADLERQISDLADEFLYAQHGTWEDGDGGTGTIVIETGTGKIVNEHGWYFTDVDYETKDF